MEIQDAIAQTLGRGMTEEQVWKMTELAAQKRFNGGDTIVRQFDKNSDLIIVLDGTAQIKTFNDDLITEIGSGSIIGEISLVDEQPRSATIRSTGFTEVAIIPAQKFRDLLANDPALAAGVYKNIAQTLCTRLRHATIHLDGLMSSKGPIPVGRG
ncbi:MAG TPA: cyclic nucleotide-binding domain-containing protein [Fimbriimonadaceae bacterium]|nr:cyclic nucleotide-binding domain-containing protein [Fimbriimonadaceae bacterium]